MTTITPEKTNEVRAAVNERLFFKNLKHIFHNSFSTMGELIQNARRADATQIDITVDHSARKIMIADNGVGIDDFNKLVDLASSGWTNEDIIANDKPFGMGFFAVFYACEKVVVRSKGQMLEATQDDIIERRTLAVVPCDMNGEHATIIEMHGVHVELLPLDDEQRNMFVRKLLSLVEGFPISVRINGNEAPRPLAVENLPGEMSSVGYLSINGVHIADQSIPDKRHYSTKFFLQGLPIEESAYGYQNKHCIVHLDSKKFIAKMPDRKSLYDSEDQLSEVKSVIARRIKEFLSDEKARMEPQEFVGKYFGATCDYRPDLLNDIDFVPKTLFENCDAAVQNMDYERTFSIPYISGQRENYSKDDFLRGRIKAWKYADTCASDSVWAVVSMKVMQKMGIFLADVSRLDSGHWLHQVIPDARDFHFEVDVTSPGERVVNYCWQNNSADFRLAKAVTITVTSESDPAFSLNCEFENNWLLVPKDGEADPYGDFDYDGWLVGNSESFDHPVNALATFKDENENFREEWESEAIRHFDLLIGGLRNEHLSKQCDRILFGNEPMIRDENLAQCVIYRVVNRSLPYTDGTKYHPKLQSMALDDDFLSKVTEALNERHGLNVDACKLIEAFTRVLKPSEFIGGEHDGTYQPLR